MKKNKLLRRLTACLLYTSQVAGQHGDVLLNAKDVTEREADKFYVIVLDEIEDVLLCRIAHSVSS